MNAKLTPGEWSVSEYPIGECNEKMAYAKIHVVAPSQDSAYPHFSIGVVNLSPNHKGYTPIDVEEAEANARLFAASKKMLEALNTFVSATITDTGQIIGLMREDFDKARAAIAAATGEQQ